MSMNEIAVMDRTGDSRTFWDSAEPDQVEAARAVFDQLRASGHMIYRATPESSVQVHKFDPEAGKLVAVPRIVGG